ncbi:hypothetical protein AURDEDRAFT_160921 [Auricularia subglabra TFB-10046 SS5]|nr:hypothetical protein AURDEDRAFT_160921 [Auricularia subglabra TFB-10046 SS5]
MMLKTALALALLFAAAAHGATYRNATLGRRAEPGPANVGPCSDDQAYCSGPEDYCCPLDLECVVDEDARTYDCVLPDGGTGGTECPEEQLACGETCCPANSSCMDDGSCLVCLNGESPCGNICCGTGSTCDAEASTCERDGDMNSGGGSTTTTTTTTKATTRGGTNPTTTGPGGSSISVGATNTPGPNGAASVKSGAWLLVGTLIAFIGA